MNKNPKPKNLFVGFNWKMNPNTITEAQELFQIYNDLNVDLSFLPVIFVPNIYLYPLQKQNFSDIDFGTQNISSKTAGAFTSQISGQMLTSVGVKYVLINHSETHRNLKLDFETIQGKFKQAIGNDLTTVLCVSCNDQETAKADLENQLQNIFNSELTQRVKSQKAIFYIALEPILNIGSGKALDCENINKYLEIISEFMAKIEFTKNQDYHTLYGGSVNASNLIEIGKCDQVDGFLIGGASIDPDQITQIFNLLK
jgi:triosephosphate isomerase (TIM)